MANDAFSLQVPSNQWAYYVANSNPDGENETVYMDFLNVHLGLHGLEAAEFAAIIKMHMNRDPEFLKLHNLYTDCLIYLFQSKFMHNLTESKKTYTLFLHTVTHPNSPQIWRRIKVSSKVTLKQLDEIIVETLGHRQYHSTEFQIPINAFCDRSQLKIAQPQHRFIKNKLQIWDPKSCDSNDYFCFHSLRPEKTPISDRICLSQFAHLFPVMREFQNKYPFDAFHGKYYSNDGKYKQRLKGLSCDAKMRFNNFSYDRDDCFSWVYDLGTQWHTNIYIENVEITTKSKSKSICEYINGSVFAAPDDIGNFEIWYLCLLKLHGDYEPVINDFKCRKDIYEWLKDVSEYYYDMICLGTDNYSRLLAFAPQQVIFKHKDSLFKQNPKWNVYFDINPILKLFMRKRNKTLRQIHKSKQMKRKMYNIRKMVCCEFCYTDSCKLKLCSKCKAAFYCSKKCQKIMWNTKHRFECLKN